MFYYFKFFRLEGGLVHLLSFQSKGGGGELMFYCFKLCRGLVLFFTYFYCFFNIFSIVFYYLFNFGLMQRGCCECVGIFLYNVYLISVYFLCVRVLFVLWGWSQHFFVFLFFLLGCLVFMFCFVTCICGGYFLVFSGVFSCFLLCWCFQLGGDWLIFTSLYTSITK